MIDTTETPIATCFKQKHLHALVQHKSERGALCPQRARKAWLALPPSHLHPGPSAQGPAVTVSQDQRNSSMLCSIEALDLGMAMATAMLMSVGKRVNPPLEEQKDK